MIMTMATRMRMMMIAAALCRLSADIITRLASADGPDEKEGINNFMAFLRTSMGGHCTPS